MLKQTIMKQSSRRDFLQTSAVLVAAAATGTSFNIKKPQPLLSFSTLGCPKWTFPEIVNFASLHGYKGIEVRGIMGQVDLSKCSEFSGAQNISATLKLMEDNNLQFVDLGSSATMHFAAGAERQKNLDEGKRFIDLARQVKCPYIRVFPNIFPKEQDKNATMDLMAKGLLELGDYAKGSGVTVLTETHGDLVKSEDIEKLMQMAEHPNTGLVWDTVNMWAVTKEVPADMYKRIKKYIRHTHIKDARLVADKIEYTLMGKGESPIFETIDILSNAGYKGYYSFEWEKLWHPELAEPEIALADFPIAMKQHFK
jgi:sugar phosphate isomerase/epimerase